MLDVDLKIVAEDDVDEVLVALFVLVDVSVFDVVDVELE